ncbi:NAD-dependent epimerase/dehydratase family protein [Acidocella facilis]|uniref:NAD-dependent epimerase/dehydratase family protein n=1 Tax=Acidocella facilis TaxID=525 RepID=UPI001F31B6E1|nr:NAD(P)-dependent oxidoreductase [Acidocella facilis]
MRWLTDELAGKLREATAKFIVTGPSGWLGQAALAALEEALGAQMHQRVLVFSAHPSEVRPGLFSQPYAALETVRIDPAYILHFAFRTKGHESEAGFVETNRQIAATLEGFIERNGAAGLFIPSSGAVYKADWETNPYGALKLEDEQRFGALAQRLGFPLVVMRIFNLAGPYMNNIDGYALGSIIRDVLRGGPIVLRADRPVWRSYVHVADVLALALALLLDGESAGPFDAAGEEVIEIGELARRVIKLLATRDMGITRREKRDPITDRYLGEFSEFRRRTKKSGFQIRSLNEAIMDASISLPFSGYVK